MNCFIWIILLLACGGNCGFRDCDCDRGCDRDWNYGRNRSRDCDCDQNCGRDRDRDCDCDWNRDRDRCGCEKEASAYETFGCQENGIPCPPPVPPCSMR